MRLQFPLFLLILWAMAMFHRREHRAFIGELTALRKELCVAPDAASLREKLQGLDWRLVSMKGSNAMLKRSFQVKGKESLQRYAIPVVLLSAILVLLQSWVFAAIYAALLAIKWFGVETTLHLDTQNAGYTLRLLGQKILSEKLPA